MDLLFSKYASPYFIIDEFLSSRRFAEFVGSIAEIENDRKMWEIYLALVSNPYAQVGSFDEFKHKHQAPPTDAEADLEATVRTSFDILQEFNPEMEG